MNHTRKYIFAGLFLLLGAAAAFAQSDEVWVANENGSFTVIDAVDNAIDVTVALPDADLDGNPEPGWGVAVSQRPRFGTDHVFVSSQTDWLFVYERATRSLVRGVNLGNLLGTPGLRLRGIDASGPQEYLIGSGRAHSLLFVAATQPASTNPPSPERARYIVLDQQCLVTGGDCSPLIATGLLSIPDSDGISVKVSHAPFGPWAVRGWITVRDDAGEAWEVYRVGIPFDLGPPAVERVHRLEPDNFEQRESLEVAAPPLREFPVLAQGTAGSLRNLENGRECTFGGNLTAVETAGPGPNSHTVLAYDAAAGQVREIDPTTCEYDTPITIPGKVVDMALLEADRWGSLFFADNSGHNIHRLDRDGALITIPLCAMGEPCDAGPRTVDAVGLICFIEADVCPKQLGSDACCTGGDICEPDVLFLEWDPGLCPATANQRVWCVCQGSGSDDPNCPCYCDCDSVAPDPACECPGGGVFAPIAAANAAMAMGDGTRFGLTIVMGGTGNGEQGEWQELEETTPGQSTTVHDTEGFETRYLVTPANQNPPPP
ncbi:hypothetical protein ABI59_06640 [Acidobacteria bacterium Mor1]|nr:hypothetical protein ABI59_06640 [Acidobacteria bacterium Mor1]